MDKRRAIQIMTKAAELYRDNLEDQKVLFLYALSSEILERMMLIKKNVTMIGEFTDRGP